MTTKTPSPSAKLRARMELPGLGGSGAADSVGYRAHVLARLFGRRLNAELRALGLSAGQFSILRALWDQDGLTLTEISQRCPIDMTTVTRTLARMEHHGLVTKRRNQEDKRVSNFFLTVRATADKDAAVACTVAVNGRALRGFSQQERELLIELMDRLEGNLR